MKRMQTRILGKSGLRISAVGLGCNNLGGRIDFEASKVVVHKAIDLGVTLFDCANIYADGKSEEFLGDILGPRRKDVLIVSKFGMDKLGAASSDGSRANMMKWVEISLKRLKTDYIDLYMLHRPDPQTPQEETLRGFEDLLKSGKVRHIGNSNFNAAQVREADSAAKAKGLTGYSAGENEYSLLARDAERELIPALLELKLGFLPFFPLANGLLTGKYQRGVAPAAGTRLAANARFAAHTLVDANFDVMERIEAFSKKSGHSLLQIAFGWLLAKPVVSSVIAGATKPEQVEANVKAAELALSAAEMAELDAITVKAPGGGFVPGGQPAQRA
jgi:aryl-alcohol dehydrogenase-like predicted oxidoreductase